MIYKIPTYPISNDKVQKCKTTITIIYIIIYILQGGTEDSVTLLYD